MRRTRMALLITLPLLLPSIADGQVANSFERVDPATVGMSAEGLSRATEALQAHIDGGDIAGVVAAVVRDGQLVYGEALGFRDIESGSPMPFDALFRAYSMTRPITALGILMLHDEGKLDVSDPVQKYLPGFADQRVLVDAQSADPSVTRPRVGDITIAHLLTHTSGIGSRSAGMYTARNVHGWDQTLAQVVDNVAALPLFEDPGTRFRYGMHSEVLGRVIEVASGMSVEDFFETRIFEPLGMTETMFYVDSDRASRLATLYRREGDGALRPFELETIPVTEQRTLTSTGVGLVSSTMDFIRFSQLFLDDGMVGGRRLLSPEAVRMATNNAVPDAILPLQPNGYWAGSGWSLGGFAVVLDPDAYSDAVKVGEFWWDGSAGTRFWIDPHEKMITIVQAQISPAGGNGFRERFKTQVQESIVERRAP
jgi:CubicO group peptidase (beta-lactamase class C family)